MSQPPEPFSTPTAKCWPPIRTRRRGSRRSLQRRASTFRSSHAQLMILGPLAVLASASTP